MEEHIHRMKRAMQLASRGLGHVSPNPMVGCVIVKDGEIIGEGYHQVYGEAHAEVNAVNACADRSMVEGAIVYVTLEPCSHTGKTPPCADMLVSLMPEKVVIANVDPNPKVAGRGIEKLRAVGIEVLTGVLEKEGEELNKRFFTAMREQRPYVMLKWAETGDGFIARENYDSKWISNTSSRALVHQWRADEDGIMVGKNTALYDNPRLNVREAEGNDPVRVVIDRNLELPNDLHLFDHSQPTICYNAMKSETIDQVVYVQVDFEDNIIPQLYHDLFQRGIYSLIIEGGTALLQSVLEQSACDEIKRFVAPHNLFHTGIPAPKIPEAYLLSDEQDIDGDELKTYSAAIK